MDQFARVTPSEPINLIAVADFDLGALLVQPSLRRVSANGQAELVEPRVMQALIALAQAGGTVMSRDALVDRCWGGRIVGDDAINRCIAKVRKLAELTEPPAFAVESIAKVGYVLKLPNSSRATIAATDAPARAPALPALPRRRSLRVLAAAAVIAACGLAASWLLLRAPSPPADRMTLRIEPFTATGGQPARELAATLTQTTIRRMSQFEIMAVSTANPATSAASVLPRYLLEGNVRTDGQSANLTVQVTERQSGRLIYSNQGRISVQATEPSIYGATVVLLGGAADQILCAELGRYTGPPRDVTDMAIRAWAVLGNWSPGRNDAELALAERAYALAPDNVPVAADLAILLYMDFIASDARSGDAEGRRALALTDQVLSAHPRNLIDRHLRADLLAALGDLRAAQSMAESALADEPENPGMQNTLSMVRLQQGDIAGSLAAYAKGRPADNEFQARQAFAQGRWNDALEITSRIDAEEPSDWVALLFRAAIQARAGQMPQARATMSRAMAVLPANLKHVVALRQVLYGLPNASWDVFRQSLLAAGMPR